VIFTVAVWCEHALAPNDRPCCERDSCPGSLSTAGIMGAQFDSTHFTSWSWVGSVNIVTKSRAGLTSAVLGPIDPVARGWGCGE
jgi:hypothetical protein